MEGTSVLEGRPGPLQAAFSALSKYRCANLWIIASAGYPKMTKMSVNSRIFVFSLGFQRSPPTKI